MSSFMSRGRWNIDRSVTIANIFHFIHGSGKACLIPFMSLYFKKLGMSATQVGILSASKSILWYIAVPIWIILAKKCDKSKCVLFYALLCALLSSLLVTLVPNIVKDVSIYCPPTPNHTFATTPAVLLLHHPNDTIASTKPSIVNHAPPPITSPVDQIKADTLLADITSTMLPMIAATTTAGTPLTAYQLAVRLLPEFIKLKPKTEEELDTFLLTNDQTKDVPEWKRKTIHQQMLKIAKKNYPKFSFKESEESSGGETVEATDKPTAAAETEKPALTEKKSDKNFAKKSPEHKQSVSKTTEPPKHKPLSATPVSPKHKISLSEVAEKIIALKEEHPSLSIDSFVDKLAEKKHWNEKDKASLKALIKKKYMEEEDEYVRNRRSINPMSLSEMAKQLIVLKEHHPSLSIDSVVDKIAENVHWSEKYKASMKVLLMKKYMEEGEPSEVRKRRSLNLTTMSHNITESVKASYHVLAHQVSAMFDDVITRTMMNSSTFLWIYAIILIGELLSCAIEPLSDNSLYELLEELDCLNRYGRHKSFTLLGTFVMGFIIALVVHFAPCQISEHVYSYNLHFYGFVFFIAIALFFVPCYPVYPRKTNWKNAKALSPLSCLVCCIDCRHFIFMMTAFVTGIVQGSLNDFLFWEIDKMEHSSYFMFGIIVSVNAAAQFLVQSYGKQFVPVMKVYLSGSIAIVLIALQLLCISFVNNAWIALFVQLLNIVGQTFLWTVINFHVNMRMFLSYNQNDSKHMRKRVRVFARASHQRNMHYTLNSLHQGLAFAVGSLISGVAYDIAGQSLVPFLRCMSVVMFVWLVIYIFFTFMCNIKSRNYTNLLDSDEDEQEQLFSFQNKSEKPKKRGYVKNKRRNKRRSHNISASSSDASEAEDWLETALKEDEERKSSH